MKKAENLLARIFANDQRKTGCMIPRRRTVRHLAEREMILKGKLGVTNAY